MYNKLLKNSALLALGNLGSKFITFLLLPFYTSYLTTQEYGTVDLLITTSSLLLPIISLSVYESVLRFVMDKSQNKEETLSNSLAVTIAGSVVCFIVVIMFFLIKGINVFVLLTSILLIIQSFQTLFSQYARGLERLSIYAVNSIVMTVSTAFFGIIFIAILNKGIIGYLISIILSNVISSIMFILSLKIFSKFKVRLVSIKKIKAQLQYSVPLIPNAFMWWIMNVSNRYFILFYLSTTVNGLFAVANKIPSLLNILNTVFFQAWQLSAIEEFKNKNKSKFFSEVYNFYSSFMFFCTATLILLSKPLILILTSKNFFNAWELVPFLLIGVLFSCFSSFLGTNYMAAKQTKGVFKTSILCGILNLILNAVLIPYFQGIGASLSVMISFLFLWIIRIFDTRKYVKIQINWLKTIASCFLLVCLSCILIALDGSFYSILIGLFLLLIIIFIHFRSFIVILQYFSRKIIFKNQAKK